jgi:ribosomal protein S18 acetylase RimI-like enzyme
MKIRKASKKDFKDIAKILKEESSKKPYNEKYTLKDAIGEVEGFAKEDLYVAIMENKIIGFIASNIQKDNKNKAYIGELWLKPDYQKKGIGKKLVKFIEEKYKKRGVIFLRLVSKKTAGAFKFYKKLKFKELKELVFMERKIK